MLCVRPCASHWVSESWEIWTTQTENKPGSYSPKASPFPQSSICSKYLWKWKCYLLSHVQLFVPLWTIASQAPLFMEFSRKECWDGLLFPSPWDLQDPGIEPGSPTLQADFLSSEPPEKPPKYLYSRGNVILNFQIWMREFSEAGKSNSKMKCPTFQPHSCEVSDSLSPPLTSPSWPPHQASLPLPTLSLKPRGLLMASLGLPAFLSRGPTCTLYHFLTALLSQRRGGDKSARVGGWMGQQPSALGCPFLVTSGRNLETHQPTMSETFSESGNSS